MARYAIWAAEQMYAGLYGMSSTCVIECDTLKEAQEVGEEESLYIMDEYQTISDELEEEVQDEIDFNDIQNEYEEDNIRAEIYRENILFQIFKIDEAAAADYTTEQLDAMYYNDPDDFIDRYCENEFCNDTLIKTRENR